ncbi:MAG: hypothetical protein H6736_10450, partial [Alphaproteobacteria bacterium]|nr:hypothetical protein [Alphaproteobacteria bacterium]
TYAPDGRQIVLDRGDVLEVVASAPGYGLSRGTFEVRKKRRQHVEIALTPMDLSPTVAPEAELAVLEAIRAWRDAAEAYVADGDAATDSAEREAREEVVRRAKAWAWAGGGQTARDYCLMAATPEACGT